MTYANGSARAVASATGPRASSGSRERWGVRASPTCFLHSTPLAHICFPDAGQVTTSLHRPYFGLGRTEWPVEDGVEYQLAHGDWIAVLRQSGFGIERLVELQAVDDATTQPYHDHVPAEWARQWPCEEIWVARKP